MRPARILLFLLAAAAAALIFPGSARAGFIRGDANADGKLDLADAVVALEHLFAGRPTTCADALDADDSGSLNIGDPIVILNYLFAQGSAPRPPFPGVGPDPTPDALGCGAAPALLAVEPARACPGERIALIGEGLPPAVDAARVLFRSAIDSEYVVPGRIAGVTAERWDIIVPGMTLSGSVDLVLRDAEGAETVAGSLPFASCPAVTGIIVGRLDAYGVVEIVGPTRFHPKAVTFYGYNLDGATAVRFEDEQAEGHIDVGPPEFVTPEGVADPKVRAVSAEVPLDFLFLYVDAYKLRARVIAEGLASNAVEFHVAKAWAEVGPTIAGAIVPGGFRKETVPITCQTYCDGEASVAWDLHPEVSIDGGATWKTATPAATADPSERARGIPTGPPAFSSEVGMLAGPGKTFRFQWASAADLPGFAGPALLRLVLWAADRHDPASSTAFVCPPIVIDNSAARIPDSIVESFDDDGNADLSETTGSWADPPGIGRGSAVGEEAPFGDGIMDLALEPIERSDGTGAYVPAYIFDTDRGEIIISDRAGKPSDEVLPVQNPGAAQGEFLFRSLRIAEGVKVRGTGSRPLVIRLRGGADPDEPAFILAGAIDVSGEDGTGGGTADPGELDPPRGLGGSAGPGGGRGGDGGSIHLFPDGTVFRALLAKAGEGPGGGEEGQTATYHIVDLTGAALSDAFGGAGGGGSYGAEGTGGQSGGTSTLSLAGRRSGRPGPMYGTSRIFPLLGGSGGGGGGGYIYRATSSLDAVGAGGNGGGGGGGAIRIVAGGSVRILGKGSILADGGDGGAVRSRGGSGGGGSGGAIHIQASGRIDIADTATIHAAGGKGGDSSSGTVARRSVAGAGGAGRVRLEPGRGVMGLAISDIAGCVTIVPPSAAIAAGDALDGRLDLTGQGIYEIDTDSGELRDPSGAVILRAASKSGDLSFESLSIASGVTLRAFGSAPLLLRVTGDARIDGSVDVSGGDAKPPAGALKEPGAAGRGGAGGGDGGLGGYVTAAGRAVDGAPGGLPALLPIAWIDCARAHEPPDPSDPVPIPFVCPALGGMTSHLPGLGISPIAGGGGGFCGAGEDAAGATAVAGAGGTAYGSKYFQSPDDGSYLPLGGSGGGGGGGTSGVPGTSGGGGGGFVALLVGGSLEMGTGALIDAKGGDSYVDAVSASGGGGGSGGGIHIAVDRAVVIRSGARLEVRGGISSAPVGGEPGDWPPGGKGAPGRILLEVPHLAGLPVSASLVPLPVLGILDLSVVPSVLVSKPYRVPRDSLHGGAITFDRPIVTLAGPAGPIAPEIVIEGAPAGTDSLGAPGRFRPIAIDSPAPGDIEFVRFRLYLFSDLDGAAVIPSVERVTFPYR